MTELGLRANKIRPRLRTGRRELRTQVTMMTEISETTDKECKLYIRSIFEGLKRDLIQDEGACDALLNMVLEAATLPLSAGQTRGVKSRISGTIASFRSGFVDQLTCCALIEQLLATALENDVAFRKLAKFRSAA